jgi:3-hydroxybutyryl-CoA dehydrogenase
MGSDIAYTIARSGQTAVLLDTSPEALDAARRRILDAARVDRLMRGGAASPAPEAVLACVAFTLDVRDFAQTGFVVENITENLHAKQALYAQLSEICPPPTVIAANTSAIPITRLGSFVVDATRVVGVHFMNPVPLKPTVELIRGVHTSDFTVARTTEFLESIGKKSVIVNDSPGFVSNRVLMLTINEAVFLLFEGVASAESVDRIFCECFGHPMGPLATADLIGLDTILHSIEVLYDEFADSKYRPCPLLKQMVRAGFHGRKTGRGFFDYS